MSKAPRWSKKDYELVAGVINRTHDKFGDLADKAATYVIAAEFIRIFYEDNPQFDVEKFHKACGFRGDA